MGMPYSEPGTFLAIRFGAAFLLLLGTGFAMRAKWPTLRVAFDCMIIGMLLHGFYLGAVFWAIDRGMPAGVSAVIVGLQPLLTGLLAGWWLKEAVTARHWMALVVGFVGVVLVLLPSFNWGAQGVNPVSVLVCFFGMVSVTLGTLYQKWIGAKVHIVPGTACQYLGAFMPVALLSMIWETRHIEWTGEMIVAMVWATLILSIGAIFILLWLIQQGSVSKVSTLFFLVPAVAALMAYVLFGEELTLVQFVGMALCAIGVAVATLQPKKKVM